MVRAAHVRSHTESIESTTASSAPPPSGAAPLYRQPLALNRDAHRELRLQQQSGDFRFAETVNAVPLAGIEFATAAGDYPILLVGNSPDDCVPSVLLGLRDGENLFVESDARWSGGYVPAFLRRYPFVLAEQGDDALAVCVDRAFAGFSEGSGERLFGEDGQEQPLLRHAIEFLGDYQQQMRLTQAMIRRLWDLQLLKPQVISVNGRPGEQLKVLQGFQVVDEERLLALDAGQIDALFRSGDLARIYAHLLSLRNVEKLDRRLRVRLTAESA